MEAKEREWNNLEGGRKKEKSAEGWRNKEAFTQQWLLGIKTMTLWSFEDKILNVSSIDFSRCRNLLCKKCKPFSGWLQRWISGEFSIRVRPGRRQSLKVRIRRIRDYNRCHDNYNHWEAGSGVEHHFVVQVPGESRSRIIHSLPVAICRYHFAGQATLDPASKLATKEVWDWGSISSHGFQICKRI